jgi:amino acid permease
MPFGIHGLIKGTAKCFYAYIGNIYTGKNFAYSMFSQKIEIFRVRLYCSFWYYLSIFKALAYIWNKLTLFFILGEEVQDPKRTIPKALISSLILITTSYLGISIILTLMQPYYMIDIEKPLNEAFNYVKMSNLSYLINFGAVTSLLTW